MAIAPDLAPLLSRTKPGRSAVPVRARHGAGFRRSDVARFRSDAETGASTSRAVAKAQSLWARCAVPGGMLLFWSWFAAANWQHFQQLFG